MTDRPPGFEASETQVSEVGLPEGATPWIGPHGQRMERLELHLTYTCPERCSFCSEDHRMKKYQEFPVTWGRVATVLRTHAQRGVNGVHFTGGEPTIHPRFIDICRLAQKLGMRTSIGTIGTMLSREDFAREALPHLDEALFSLHGPSAEIHDPIAGREGSFERVTRAMRLARELAPGFGLFMNTVVCQDNVEALPETAALASELGVQLLIVSNTTPEGAGFDRYEKLAVPLETLARILPQVPERAAPGLVRFFSVPMCILGEHGMLSNDLHWDPRVTVEWQTAPGKVAFSGIYSWAPDRRRVYPEECGGCSRKSVCMGVFDRYAELYSTEVLSPI
jgi:MoaA/NifB/PqqE/SkfB family radical SAM enzyme